MTRNISHHNAGFSLIQVSIGLIVLGLLSAGILQSYKLYRHNKTMVQDRSTQEKIANAISDYIRRNGYYPCPADPEKTLDDSDFGKEQRTGGACTSASSPDIFRGTVPVATLGLPQSLMVDPYGNKLTYTVSQSLTADVNGAYTITVTNNASPAISKTVPFVIVSHGADRKGAIPFNHNAVVIPCGTSSDDSENCNGDKQFHDFSFSSLPNINATRQFDDTLMYSLVQKETTLWIVAPPSQTTSGLNLASRVEGNVGIGIANPSAKLDVVGGKLTVTSTNLSEGNITVTDTLDADKGVVKAKALSVTNYATAPSNIQATEIMKAGKFCYNATLSACGVTE